MKNVADILTESYAADIGSANSRVEYDGKEYNPYTLEYGNLQVGHIYFKGQRDTGGRGLLRADEYDRRHFGADTFRLVSPLTKKGSLEHTSIVKINIRTGTIAFLKDYESEDVEWETPRKFTRLYIHDAKGFYKPA